MSGMIYVLQLFSSHPLLTPETSVTLLLLLFCAFVPLYYLLQIALITSLART
jgi:hypothetical protein